MNPQFSYGAVIVGMALLAGCAAGPGASAGGPREAAIAMSDALLRHDVAGAAATIYAKDPTEERGVEAVIQGALAEMDWVAALTERFGEDGRHVVAAAGWSLPDFTITEEDVKRMREEFQKGVIAKEADGSVEILGSTKPNADVLATVRLVEGKWKVVPADWGYPKGEAEMVKVMASTQRYIDFTRRVRAGEFLTPTDARQAWQQELGSAEVEAREAATAPR